VAGSRDGVAGNEGINLAVGTGAVAGHSFVP
jgi:hypothetical protein